MQLTWDTYNPDSTADRILVLGPSLGGNAKHQWTLVAERLADRARIVFVDHPGHALSPVWTDGDEPNLDILGDGVMDVISRARDRFGNLPVVFAGLSISGAMALHLARDHADALAGVVVLCSAATVGEPEKWLERARDVETSGTQQLLADTEQRWFSPGFRARKPEVVADIMQDLAMSDDRSYAQLCRALAAHDVRTDLAGINLPVLVVAGGEDPSTPREDLDLVAAGIPGAELRIVPGAQHQVTVEAPDEIAELLGGFLERVTAR